MVASQLPLIVSTACITIICTVSGSRFQSEFNRPSTSQPEIIALVVETLSQRHGQKTDDGPISFTNRNSGLGLSPQTLLQSALGDLDLGQPSTLESQIAKKGWQKIGSLQGTGSIKFTGQNSDLGLSPESLVQAVLGHLGLGQSSKQGPNVDIVVDGVPQQRPVSSNLKYGAKNNGPGAAGVRNVGKDGFRVTLDVPQFQPEEIGVKIVDDYVVIEAKYEEEKDEHGSVSEKLVRKYVIPETVESEKITSSISTDGVLTIHAPFRKPIERKIKVELTGEPALKDKKEAAMEAAPKSMEGSQESDEDIVIS